SVEVTDGIVVDSHRRQARRGGAPPVAHRRLEAFTVRLGRALGTLEIDEMLQHRLIERRQLHDHAGGQIPRIDGEVAPAEARCAAECRGDVPYGAEMSHVLDGDVENATAPAGGR